MLSSAPISDIFAFEKLFSLLPFRTRHPMQTLVRDGKNWCEPEYGCVHGFARVRLTTTLGLVLVSRMPSKRNKRTFHRSVSSAGCALCSFASASPQLASTLPPTMVLPPPKSRCPPQPRFTSQAASRPTDARQAAQSNYVDYANMR